MSKKIFLEPVALSIPPHNDKLEPYQVTTANAIRVIMKPYYMTLTQFKRVMTIKYGICTVKKLTKRGSK